MRIYRRDYPEYAVATVTETTGKDMSTASVAVGLSADTRTPPASWQAPDAQSVTGSVIVAKMLIGQSATPGDYYLWVKVTDTPEIPARPATNDMLRVI